MGTQREQDTLNPEKKNGTSLRVINPSREQKLIEKLTGDTKAIKREIIRRGKVGGKRIA